ncbi:MAG: dienelactone hydrolase family protein [Saprospiraceae bacterium]
MQYIIISVSIFAMYLIPYSCFGQLQHDHYFYYESRQVNSNKWIVLLPGSSGLTIFDDQTFYHRQAETLQSRGFDVILIDYKKYYKENKSPLKPKGTTGDKIVWVVQQVIELSKSKHEIDSLSVGHLLGWSLAGEGVIQLVEDTSFIKRHNIKSAALYYPSNQENRRVSTIIPLLVQVGEFDNVVKTKKLQESFISNHKLLFITYANSFHGFDVETLDKAKHIRFPPIFGKKYKFQYNAQEAFKARNLLFEFLNQF